MVREEGDTQGGKEGSLGAQKREGLTARWGKLSIYLLATQFSQCLRNLTSSWGLNQDNRTHRILVCKLEFEVFTYKVASLCSVI